MRLPVLSNNLYVPAELVRPEHTHQYTYQIERTVATQSATIAPICENCQLWGKRWRKPNKSKTCEDVGYTLQGTCQMFRPKTGRQKVYEEITTWSREGDMYSFPRGDLGKLDRIFGDLQIQDQRVAPGLGHDLQLTCTLRPEQQDILDTWLRYGFGIVQAYTGWGKSVLMAALFCKLGLRVLVLADKDKHLATVREALETKTDLLDLEKQVGYPICGYLNTETKIRANGSRYNREKFGTYYPITLSTYQSFNSDRGKTLLPLLKDQFGVVWHEESHHESAETFHHVTKSFNPWVRGGQTATPERPDGLHVVMYDTIGPVVAKATNKDINIPYAQFLQTGVHVDDYCFRGMYASTQVDSFLAKDEKYFDYVFQAILDDIRVGRKVLVFSKRKTFNAKLHRAITMAGYEAVVMEGGQKNKKNQKPQSWYAQQITEGKLDVIIGTTVIEENYDVPPLDCVHMPFTNFTEKTELQVIGRVCRTMPGKPQPWIRVYVWKASEKLAVIQEAWRRKLYKKHNYDLGPDIILDKNALTMNLD